MPARPARLDDHPRTARPPVRDYQVMDQPPVTTASPRPTGGADARSDEALLAGVADRDRGALEELYRRHAPWLLVRLGRRCARRDQVEEAVQDTFLAVWRKPGAYRGDGPVGAWLWGVAIRRLIDRLRRQPALTLLPVASDLVPPWSRGSDTTTRSAEDLVLLGVEHGDLAGALGRLSPELRAVLQATVLDGLTTREAAALLGIPPGTVKTRAARARRELREALA